MGNVVCAPHRRDASSTHHKPLVLGPRQEQLPMETHHANMETTAWKLPCKHNPAVEHLDDDDDDDKPV
jgi:hypothetical protein